MIFRQLVGVTLIVSCASAAWGDAKDDALDGIWLPATAELSGEKFPDEVRTTIKLEIKGDQYTVTAGTAEHDRGTCKRNPSAKPKTLDIMGTEGPNKGKTILAIYERKGDTLRVCYDLSGKARPAEFKTTAGSPLFLVEYELQKP